MSSYRRLSLWHDQVHAAGDPLTPRPGLDGDAEADVAIVGAGFTGLWTAYYLLERDPSLRVTVIEQEIAGFGASGRNGGWCSALFPTSAAALAAEHGSKSATALRAAMRETVAEVGRVADAEGIACDFAPGGTIALIRSGTQQVRAEDEAAEAARWGDDVRLLDATDARALVGADGVRGATFDRDCARIQPAALARGLARVVEARGARLVERTRAEQIAPHAVRTDRGTVRADVVVRATEAWTSQLPGHRRDVVPVYSLMIATEPLADAVLDEIGLRDGMTFTDHRNLIVYGQRTADGRIAFGGRGAPYHLNSSIDPRFDRDPHVFSALRATLHELFPVLTDARITHAWGGPLAIARDWHASVGLDPATGIAWAGGYVGDGVATTNLAGRTIADLVSGTPSPLTSLPWVGHRSRRWEPEPLRWLGINAGLAAMHWADVEERVTRRPSVAARVMAPLIGG